MKRQLKKLYALLDRRKKIQLAFLLAMMIVASLLEVLGVGVIPTFVIAVADPGVLLNYPVIGNLLDAWGISTQEDLLFFGALFLIVVFILKNAFIAYYGYVKSSAIRGMQVQLGRQLFTAYIYAPYTFHLGRNTAELLRNTNIEIRQLFQYVVVNLLRLVMDVLMIVFLFTFLVVVEPLITLITFLFLGLLAGTFLKLLKAKVKHYGKLEQINNKELIKAVNQGLGGIKHTKVLKKENFFIKRFSDCNTKTAEALRYKEIANHLIKPLIETFAITSMLVVTLLLMYQGRPLTSIIPILALFGTASIRLLPTFREMAASWTNLRYYLHVVDPIYDDLLELKSNLIEEKAVFNRIESLRLSDEIAIKNLGYSYPGSTTFAIEGINLKIKKGSAVAFIGTSGAGKSTLADLLLGLLKPTSGNIEVDGVDIRTTLRGWQMNTGYIPQSIYLSDESIRQNIAWGIPETEIKENKLNQAVKAAQLEGLLSVLPNGLDTVVGEREVRLSGGQSQRIGIARALYHNPQVLIMDEATSALDSKTERSVLHAIERLKGERTVIIIAHRLSTVKNCDRMVKLENGKIVFEGRFEEWDQSINAE